MPISLNRPVEETLAGRWPELVAQIASAAPLLRRLEAADKTGHRVPVEIRVHAQLWRSLLGNPMHEQRGLPPESFVGWLEQLLAIIDKNALAVAMTTDQPTDPGRYWLSFAPENRRFGEGFMTAVNECEIVRDIGKTMKVSVCGFSIALDQPILVGAKWAPRLPPPDPFTDKESLDAVT